MSWYQDADKSKELNYSAPKISQQTLDASGNYVSPAGNEDASSSSAKGNLKPIKLGTSIIQ